MHAILLYLLVAFCVLAALVHITSAAVVVWRAARQSKVRQPFLEPVTIIRPVCGLDGMERRTLASTFHVEHPRVELLFCVKSQKDPAAAYIAELQKRYPHSNAKILVGDDLGTQNPKLNNIAKGWRAAGCDWVLIADSNLTLPTDYVARAMAGWTDRAGLVCAPPIGSEPASFWAEIECAFLNTYQARWQYTVDSLGYGFAQGKTMLWHRTFLERRGGIRALASELAEDAAATKLVRGAGLTVRLADPSFFQPLGYRRASQVFARQLRWAQLRRQSFPAHYVPELLTGILPPMLAGGVACGSLGGPALLFVALFAAAWYAVEAWLALAAGWHISWRSPLAWAARDFLIPAIWLRAWFRDAYEWRGNAIDMTAPASTSNSRPA